MTIITVEVSGRHRTQDMRGEARQAARQAELEGHATTLREIFLGKPGENGIPTDPPSCK